LHPSIDHFIIALPVVILLLEITNLMMKKKAVGGVSFFLLILTVVLSIAAYLTGLVDGKEAYPLLSESAKTALSEHKLLGIYLMLGSVIVLVLKLFAMTGNGILKALYILTLMVFVVMMLNQGKEGGKLVYTHGINVAQVQVEKEKIKQLNNLLEDETQKVNLVQKEFNAVQLELRDIKEIKIPTPILEVKKSIMETTGVEENITIDVP
jgi:uncharacterized membrane protein